MVRLEQQAVTRSAESVGELALHYMHYNFCRIHQTLRVTPAMAAGVSGHVWDIEEIASLLEKSVTIAA